MENMTKGIPRIWPSGLADQITPRAAPSSSRAEECNPFESFDPFASSTAPPAPTASLIRAHYKTPSTSSLSSLSVPRTLAGDTTPSGLLTPGGTICTQSAKPTTSVSIKAPDFTMKLPPLKSRQQPFPANAAGSSTACSCSPCSCSFSYPSQSTASTTRNTTAPRGHLTIKLVEARNLAVGSTHRSAPYAVVSFDKNEFIGRESIDAGTADASGTVIPRSPADLNGIRSRARTVTPAAVTDQTAETQQGDTVAAAAAISPRNPVWKHSVTFDVTQERQAIYLSVYDRSAGEEGFLGMKVITPRLVHRMASDQWYPLVDRNDVAEQTTAVRGEIRVQISYERLAAKKLTPTDFEYLKLIGRGTFGRVFQVRKKDTKRIYAMKVLSKKEIALKKEVTHTMGERKILEKSLDCPFLVGLKFSFQSEQELYFVTDYKSGGELFWHLQREGRFTEERARFYIAELVIALGHLHKYDIVYRDLKPENILLDATGHVALCDFGLSKPDLGAGQLTNTFCGTTEYLAPEVLLDESGYSKLVDFWSLGVLLFEMCCGWSPFYAEDTQQMYRNICFGKIKFPRGAIGDDGKQFVKGLLNRNPKHRLGAHRDAEDLMAHAFFKDIDFEALARKERTPPFKPLVESDESVANFDPEFTERDLSEVAMLGGSEEIEGAMLANSNGGSVGATGNGADSGSKNGAGGAVAINSKRANGVEADGKTCVNIGGGGDDDRLSSSIQDKFRGFSYSGTYDGSIACSFGGRRCSGGFGLGGASLGMSKMSVTDAEHGDDNHSNVQGSLDGRARAASPILSGGTADNDEEMQ